ncbi:MAG: hypothetical protein JNJ99_07400 [Crocinitomicaceae bacterium]|nr:hypothetical protein [Crocinitomicaceae bacterium]
MKKIFGLVLVLFLTSAVYGQLWFDVGLKGGGGSGFLMNKTLSSDPRFSINPGSNYFYGGKIGINYGYNVSIATDFTLGNNTFSFNQAELGAATNTFKYTINYKTFNITPLFRFTKDASYIELGPEFCMVNKANYSDEYTLAVKADATDEINSKLTNLVFGFGGYIVGNEIVALQMGMRVHYTLGNLTSPDYESGRYPFTNYSDVPTGVATKPFTLQFHLELNISLGQIARSTTKCGRRVAFLSF